MATKEQMNREQRVNRYAGAPPPRAPRSGTVPIQPPAPPAPATNRAPAAPTSSGRVPMRPPRQNRPTEKLAEARNRVAQLDRAIDILEDLSPAEVEEVAPVFRAPLPLFLKAIELLEIGKR